MPEDFDRIIGCDSRLFTDHVIIFSTLYYSFADHYVMIFIALYYSLARQWVTYLAGWKIEFSCWNTTYVTVHYSAFPAMVIFYHLDADIGFVHPARCLLSLEMLKNHATDGSGLKHFTSTTLVMHNVCQLGTIVVTSHMPIHHSGPSSLALNSLET